MSPGQFFYNSPHPRRQSQLLADLLARERTGFRAVLLGRRREGKTNLLREVFNLLFDRAEGPVPVFYAFDRSRGGETLARHFAASLCQQARAFLMRQEELMGEPLAELERELERPGLPLSLTELGRELLALAAEQRLEFAASMPAQFAHREGRPVCLLLDDAESLPENSIFLPAIEAPQLSWLITGRAPLLARMAGRRSWPVARLEPLALSHALALARAKCGDAGLRYCEPAWRIWFEIAGPSPGLMDFLITSAAANEVALANIEDFARAYISSLASGTIGNWLAGRWEAAVPNRAQRIDLARQLARLAGAGEAAVYTGTLAEALLAEEWLEESGVAPILNLAMPERDWLALVSGAGFATQREARLTQEFLLRVRKAEARGASATPLRVLHEALHAATGPKGDSAREHAAAGALPSLLPGLCAAASTEADEAELFWCYGIGGARNLSPRLTLIALCEKEPNLARINRWEKLLSGETERLRQTAAGFEEDGGSGAELWVVVPPDAPLQTVSSERRFHWAEFQALLAGVEVRGGASLSSSTGGALAEGPPLAAQSTAVPRGAELQARMQWLREQLAAGQPSTSSARGREATEASPAPATTSERAADREWRASISLGLLLLSADLLALTAEGDPAANEKMAASVREMRVQAQRLLEELGGRR